MASYTFCCPVHGEFEVRKPMSEFTRTEPCLVFEGEESRRPCMENSSLVLKAPPKEGIRIQPDRSV